MRGDDPGWSDTPAVYVTAPAVPSRPVDAVYAGVSADVASMLNSADTSSQIAV